MWQVKRRRGAWFSASRRMAGRYFFYNFDSFNRLPGLAFLIGIKSGLVFCEGLIRIQSNRQDWDDRIQIYFHSIYSKKKFSIYITDIAYDRGIFEGPDPVNLNRIRNSITLSITVEQPVGLETCYLRRHPSSSWPAGMI